MKISARNLIRLAIISVSVISAKETALANTQFDAIKDLNAQDAIAQIENALQIPLVEYTSESLRDPFKSLLHKDVNRQVTVDDQVREEIVLPSLTVQGIILGSELKQVIINNKILKIGEVIEEVNILDIQKDGIAVLYKNQRFQVPAPGSTYRK